MSEDPKEEKNEFGLAGVYLPSEILFNFNLTNTDKILFGFIRNLSTSNKGCTASNRYLGNMLKVTPQTISDSVRNLKENKYLKVKFSEKNKGTFEQQRHIYVDENYIKNYRPLIEYVHGVFVSKTIPLKEFLNGDMEDFLGGVLKSRNNTNSDTEDLNTENNLFSFSKEKEMDGEAVMVQSCKKKSWRKDETQPTTHPSKELNNISSFEKKRESLRGKHTSSAGDMNAYDIIDKWESLGFPKIPSEHRSSTLKKIDSLIAGTFFEGKLLHNGNGKYLNRPFTKAEILKAIENRARGAFDPEYVPTDQKIKRDLQKLPLTVWFYNSNASDSRFLYDFEKKYKKIPAKLKLIPDEFPEYTESIIDTYVDKILYGVVPKEWSIKDQNNFRKASQRLREYFIDNEDRSRYIKPHQIDEQADVLIRALRNHYGNDDDDENVSIHSANLCSDYTFHNILPSYMGRQRMLNRTTDFY